MSFFKNLVNTLSGGMNCPSCGTPGAKKSGDGIVCLNPLCQYFGATKRAEGSASRSGSESRASTNQGRPSAPPAGGTVAIEYTNFQGQQKTFIADKTNLRRRHNHILAHVAPSWKEIALSRDRIQNLSEVDLHLPERDRSNAPQPTARERQVLGYHKKYGTTSPLYEKIRAKYPNW
jgi:uncharacterized Zn finger protein (UPF0148 family)